MFAIPSSEVFALGGDLLYIFYGNCSGAFVSSLVRGYLLVRGFAFRGSTVTPACASVCRVITTRTRAQLQAHAG